ncbi:MAG TPA: fused MFS/spermidine synthase, partial [Terracidiphilus sp.]|nr:fused MFS/spermidine synthase [Terracidiphilus sp.]
DYQLTYPLVLVAAAMLGAAFPLISHAAIGPERQAGQGVGLLYLSNIAGSALGSFLVGFVVMDYLSLKAVSVLLLGLGFALAMVLLRLAHPEGARTTALGGAVVCCILAAGSGPLFAHFYERLFYESTYRKGTTFKEIVENRNGVISVDHAETVYGGGVYDGHFNIDPATDTNGVFRCYAIAGLHPDPKRVLIIGLSSGSWAQILAHMPGVQDVTIVEINPGYLPLIAERPHVASLLHNPHVHIVIDDGRRWLVSHPDARFDFILMNTTLNWRAHASNLLSVEFMQMLRSHMLPGGVAYYNTTSSGEVQRTGATVFADALRVANFLAVSDSPIIYDRARVRTVLASMQIDGEPVYDLSDPRYRAALERTANLPVVAGEDPSKPVSYSIEGRASLLARLKDKRLVTDDNMGTEWQ